MSSAVSSASGTAASGRERLKRRWRTMPSVAPSGLAPTEMTPRTLVRGSSTYLGPSAHVYIAYVVDFGTLAFWVVLGLWLASSIFASGRREQSWALVGALVVLFVGHMTMTVVGIRRRGLMKALLRRRLQVTTEGVVLPLLQREHRWSYPDNFVPWGRLHRMVWVGADPTRGTTDRLRVELDVPKRYLHDETRVQYFFGADEVGDFPRVIALVQEQVPHKVKVQDVGHRQRLRDALV